MLAAQNRLDAGLFIGTNQPIVKVQPVEPFLQQRNNWSGTSIGGFLAWQAPNETTFIEANFSAFTAKHWLAIYDGFLNPNEAGYRYRNLDLGIRQRIVQANFGGDSKLHLGFRAGLGASLVSGNSENVLVGVTAQGSPSVVMSYDLPGYDNEFRASGYLGLILEYEFGNGITLFSRATYHQGIGNLYSDDILYGAGATNQTTTTPLLSRGSRWAIDAGISIPIFRK